MDCGRFTNRKAHYPLWYSQAPTSSAVVFAISVVSSMSNQDTYIQLKESNQNACIEPQGLPPEKSQKFLKPSEFPKFEPKWVQTNFENHEKTLHRCSFSKHCLDRCPTTFRKSSQLDPPPNKMMPRSKLNVCYHPEKMNRG